MVVYVENLFINNFTLLLFIQYLCCVLTGINAKIFRILLASVAGSVIYIVSLYIGSYGYALLALLPFLNIALITSFSHVKDYLATVFIFITIYFALIGSTIFIAYLANIHTVNILYFLGYIPFFISISFILITLLICYIKHEIMRINNNNGNIYDVELINEHYSCRTKAYYDTGNMVCTKNGEWVVIVSDYIYNKLMPAPTEEVGIATIASEYSIPVTPILLKIYFQDGMNKIYKVMAGKGKIDTNRYKIILHKDMR